ncbi:MAG: 5-oxoprolinase/urea amidolyase family protein [Paracoccus sp. (in: a-proteobacteria)]
MRFLPAGKTNLLVELDSLEQVLALHSSLRTDPVAGMTDLIPAAQTLMVGFDPDCISAAGLARAISPRDLTGLVAGTGCIVEVPVEYNGQDLDEVADLTGLDRAEVIIRHTAIPWLAAFNGFAPGFCYLTGGDPDLNVPRRSNPRTEIPAGSVALAGAFSGVYPQSSPGGWQIIGTTPVPMWDLGRAPPAWLTPGDTVRFVDIARSERCWSLPPLPHRIRTQAAPLPACLEVLAAPFPATFQDDGRKGLPDQGVAGSGAVDQGALRALNRLLGNPPRTPALEVIGGGFRFRSSKAAVIALTGAPRKLILNGGMTEFSSHQPVAVDAGDEVLLTAPDGGVYGYLGVRGGLEVTPVLGSASTDTLARIGPDAIVTGSRIGLRQSRADAVTSSLSLPVLPRPGDLVKVDVIMGPRSDWFTDEAADLFLSQKWKISPQSSRVGKRLEGEVSLARRDQRELPSEATPLGAIQIPHSGQPVLFLADHPLTGGYPVIAVVAPHHLDLVAQVPPGGWLRFCASAPFAPHNPDIDRGF